MVSIPFVAYCISVNGRIITTAFAVMDNGRSSKLFAVKAISAAPIIFAPSGVGNSDNPVSTSGVSL